MTLESVCRGLGWESEASVAVVTPCGAGGLLTGQGDLSCTHAGDVARHVCRVCSRQPATRNLTGGLTGLLLLPGRKDPREVDGSRGHRLPQVHICQRRLELRDCHVGSHVIWRETLLGYVQPRCECQQHPVATSPHPRGPTGSGVPWPPS